MHLKKLLLAGLMAITTVAVAPDRVDAAPRGTRAARAKPARPARAATPRPARATPAKSLSNVLKSPTHLAKVRSLKATRTDHVMHGEPDGKGSVNFYAAQAELISAGGVKQKEVRSLNYGTGKDTSQRLEVSGIKDGKWRGHLIGTVSTHDFASMSWPQYTSAVKARISSDRIRISYDHGPGTAEKVIAKGVKSEAATAVPITVPLKKNGVTRIIYDRTNASGQTVGDSRAYVGRIVELSWNGN